MVVLQYSVDYNGLFLPVTSITVFYVVNKFFFLNALLLNFYQEILAVYDL